MSEICTIAHCSTDFVTVQCLVTKAEQCVFWCVVELRFKININTELNLSSIKLLHGSNDSNIFQPLRHIHMIFRKELWPNFMFASSWCSFHIIFIYTAVVEIPASWCQLRKRVTLKSVFIATWKYSRLFVLIFCACFLAVAI